MKEYILCAAIHYIDDNKYDAQPFNIEKGFVLTGWRHFNILPIATRLGRKTIGPDHKQGFLTNTNRFVDRKEGRRIALEAGQIEEGKTFQKRDLFSVDLY